MLKTKVALAVAGIAVLSAAAAEPKFEVASVKPAVVLPPVGGGGGGRTGGGCPQSMKMDRGRVDIRCATVVTLIGYAFRFSPDRVIRPAWMMGLGSPRFDIAAKIPQGASESQVPEMVRGLLADRFKLALHRETVRQAIYALVVAKGGLKIEEADRMALAPAADFDASISTIGFYGGTQDRAMPDRAAPGANGRSGTATISNPRTGTVRATDGPDRLQRWEASSITLAGLADLLDRVAPLPSPVIDMTGVKGRYRLALEVSLDDLSDPADMEAAVLKGFNNGLRKLGLQLERRRGPVETLVVDHVEKTPTEN